MKKIFQILVVFALVLAVIGVAKNSPAWASSPTRVESSGANSPLPTRIVIAGSGNYNVGGVCTLTVEFKGSQLLVRADAEVPLATSQKVPFFGKGNLFYPGCHVVQVKQDRIVSSMRTEDGNAKICFGASPAMSMTIYYYLDDPGTGSRAWIPLPTAYEDQNRLACAPALYTGVYMPAGELTIIPVTGFEPSVIIPPVVVGASVLPPPARIVITGSGTYSVGGICAMTVNYNVNGLSDAVEVAFPSEDTLKIPSQDVDGLFYFPGCRVLHYRNQTVQKEMTKQEGNWQICFAAIPGKTMKIYYYEDVLTNVAPPWKPLETTTWNGMACAGLAAYSAVYTPAGK